MQEAKKSMPFKEWKALEEKWPSLKPQERAKIMQEIELEQKFLMNDAWACLSTDDWEEFKKQWLTRTKEERARMAALTPDEESVLFQEFQNECRYVEHVMKILPSTARQAFEKSWKALSREEQKVMIDDQQFLEEVEQSLAGDQKKDLREKTWKVFREKWITFGKEERAIFKQGYRLAAENRSGDLLAGFTLAQMLSGTGKK